MGWTLSASELWVAAQRTLPNWVRRRLNPTLIVMISQGGMAVGGVIWGSAATIGGASYTLIGVAVLSLTSLLAHFVYYESAYRFGGLAASWSSAVVSIASMPGPI